MNKYPERKNKNATPRKSKSFSTLSTIPGCQTQNGERQLPSVVKCESGEETSSKLVAMSLSNDCLSPDVEEDCSDSLLRRVPSGVPTANIAERCSSSDLEHDCLHDDDAYLRTDASLEIQSNVMRSLLAEEEFDIVKEIHEEGTKVKEKLTKELSEEGDRIKSSIQTTERAACQYLVRGELNRKSNEKSRDVGRADLIILHTEKDLRVANDLMADLAALQPDINQDLFSNIDHGRTGMGSLDTIHERYGCIGILVTPNLDEDELTMFQVEGLMTFGLENGKDTAHRVVPFWYMEKRECKTVCLRAIKGLDYSNFTSDKRQFSSSFKTLIKNIRKQYS
ncbi:hypothetical protein MAR_016051 [Mya arenaria]|uniref:Uncharacterized protein n=1 Tax=Mya arenaria TaxID=6604 RepID=A0ABY7FM03_MYAAR|nr:uncharacterized protein LOC128212096 [Mya arenaria]WAR22077.1 hypothetical protein MAR_016051 [Mya arenaria]